MLFRGCPYCSTYCFAVLPHLGCIFCSIVHAPILWTTFPPWVQKGGRLGRNGWSSKWAPAFKNQGEGQHGSGSLALVKEFGDIVKYTLGACPLSNEGHAAHMRPIKKSRQQASECAWGLAAVPQEPCAEVGGCVGFSCPFLLGCRFWKLEAPAEGRARRQGRGERGTSGAPRGHAFT